MPVCSVCATNKKKMIPLSPTALFFSFFHHHPFVRKHGIYFFFVIIIHLLLCCSAAIAVVSLLVRSVYIYVRVSHSRIISAAPARPRVAHLLSQVDIITILYVSHQVVAMQWRVLNCTLCVRHHSHTDTFIEPDANSHFC